MLNMCANNYLGLAEHPEIVMPPHTRASIAGDMAFRPCASSAERRPYTKQLEAKISEFLGMEDTILYTSCFDANGGSI